ncbi:MAG: helix-turn-helix domain-containing protein [Pyrinomonadaceae bacterium]
MEDFAVYTLPVAGRPAKKERTAFGERLYAVRQQAGLSQQQLADRLGITQRAYAHWERNPVALRADQLVSLAQALNVSVDDLVGINGSKKRGSGPTGKMKQLFEAASRLPRSQQQKIAALLEPFIAHHAGR